MSKRLLLWLNKPDAAWLDPADTPLALGALAVHAARCDLPPDVLGSAELDTILARRFELTRREAAEMRAICEALATAVRPGEDLARLISAHVPEVERRSLADCMSEEVRRRRPRDSKRLQASLAARLGLDGVTPRRPGQI
ncbi:hypothetical protein SAMN05421853_104206 [Roseivivax halotolerans]|jgi:hypothetical protein|uniref:Tellurite resistance protein TerB n=1 Tax=Roseivivax halotolerans TaxID=93684 RepID=A0A1I5XXW6_9RHOB|nr:MULTISPECIES: hypothetical protein [Roseivivax]QFT62248.1 hypothetical protein FIU91_04850 [Roseivivax sp. THAF30]SFQ36720.1 hypothetical protein SAMN05421853_104206 [Roseivivax halotolerans]